MLRKHTSRNFYADACVIYEITAPDSVASDEQICSIFRGGFIKLSNANDDQRSTTSSRL